MELVRKVLNPESIFNTKIERFKVNKFLNDEYHENFGIQWNRFNKLQLDSFNGSNESCDRILVQSELEKSFLKIKLSSK